MKVMTGVLLTLCALGAAGAWAAGGPTDPQIAAIVVTANQVDIDAGKLARSKAHSKDVSAFGQLMVTDHTAVNKSATELVRNCTSRPSRTPPARACRRAVTRISPSSRR